MRHKTNLNRHLLIKTASLLTLLAFHCSLLQGAVLFWPTPNDAYTKGLAPENYLQPTQSGRLASADWGCTRNGGNRFHEGIDLKPIIRDARNRAIDPIFAASDGVVAHINTTTAHSNYGKYVVIAHQDLGLEWYSLYAHLSQVEANLRVGRPIAGGQRLGMMGNTSSSINIPHSRAHLHFEVGLRLSSRFDRWFDLQGFSSPNHHDSWNGMNLVGTHPLAFFDALSKDADAPVFAYFLSEPVSFDILVHFVEQPDFLMRNPVFLRGGKMGPKGGWYQIGFTWYGLPVHWKYVPEESIDRNLDRQTIHVRSFQHEQSCKTWVVSRREQFYPTNDLIRLVGILKAGE